MASVFPSGVPSWSPGIQAPVAQCKRCGKCCMAIPLPVTYADLAGMAKHGHPDALFVLQHWKPISVKKARHLNPEFLKEGGGRKSIWTCRKLNHRTNMCRVHAYKPKVCSEFPYYGRNRFPYPVTSKCGYPKINPSVAEREATEHLKQEGAKC